MITRSSYAIFCSLALICTLCFFPQNAEATGGLTLNQQYIFSGAATEWYAEESYYAAPVVADLDGDGTLEILNVAYGLSVVDAATGALKWRVNAGHDRNTAFQINQNPAGKVLCDFAVKDIDADGRLDIVIAYENGSVSVLNHQGYFKPGWPQKPTDASIRSLVVSDVNLDGSCEIIVGAGVKSAVSVWMYSPGGTILPGWPQLDPSQDANQNKASAKTAYSYGVFANGITVGNLDADPKLEVIVPTDTAYIDVYHSDGSLMLASELFENRPWGKVALYEDNAQEQLCENEGWGWPIKGDETRAQLYRAELGHSAATYSDLDGDGTSEVIITALMTDRTAHTQTNFVSPADTRYMTVAVFNQDRSRFVNEAKGYDWSVLPMDLGGRLRQNDPVSMATGVRSEPVCVDLNGDGQKEILFTSYNGKLHCFSLDGKEQGAWPFRLPQTSASVYEYATTPTCADLNGDGTLEVIFASWTSNESNRNTGVDGALYVTDYNGNLLASHPLPKGYATYEGIIHSSNDVMARPVVADIDKDGKQEILLNTTYRALCVYEVGGSNAPTTPTTPTVPTLTPGISPLRLDGQAHHLGSYLLDGSNYVKLRDVAKLLAGSKAQFEVTWSATAGIGITKGQAYTPVGGELRDLGTQAKAYTAGKATLNVNSNTASLDACTVDGNNYFKLRDLGQALDFQVSWDATTKTVIIDTNLPYTG